MLSQNDIKFDVEGFGIAILEANLLGIPAIGSRDTGIEDAIVHNETGKLVDPYSVEEILEAIDETIINKEKLSMEAIEWAHQHNWTEITTQYLRLITNA
jgi:phosphatidylinositol alpha-1,6-mannosyltransferase